MKKFLLPLFAIVAVMFMDSCTTSKQVPYMQNIDSISLAASQYRPGCLQSVQPHRAASPRN